jgi:hypothetical protein
MSGHALPEWLVSSRHARTPRPSDAASRPYGLQHARRVGSAYTACGLPALGWRYFWDMRFGEEPDSTCAECLYAVVALEAMTG